MELSQKFSNAIKAQLLNVINSRITSGSKLQLLATSIPSTSSLDSVTIQPSDVLAEMPLGAPFAPSVPAASTDPKLSANSIAPDLVANNTGTAVAFRIVNASGATLIYGTVGAFGSGADLELDTTAIQAGGTVTITQFDLLPFTEKSSIDFCVDMAGGGMDPIFNTATEDQKRFFNRKYDRIQAYSPFFDAKLAWYNRAWDYEDVYAIKNSDSDFATTQQYILQDAAGHDLYIDFDCKGPQWPANPRTVDMTTTGCPQFAADISAQGWKDTVIARCTARVQTDGYRGIWLDDVNLTRYDGTWSIADGNGSWVNPIDPNTGVAMTGSDWDNYMATFIEEIRAALPTAELVANVYWGHPRGAEFDRIVNAVDYINIERGFVDYGITQGSGNFGFDTMLGYIDHIHSLGKNVILDTKTKPLTEQEFMFALSTYLLVKEEGDLLGLDDMARNQPDTWDHRLDARLGRPVSSRIVINTGSSRYYARIYQRGAVYVVGPGDPTTNVNGNLLTERSGAIVYF